MTRTIEEKAIRLALKKGMRILPNKGLIIGVKGKPVGSINKNTGYVSINIRRKTGEVAKRNYTVLAHRLIWTYVNGPIPDGQEIDHKDNVRSHNGAKNLQLATKSEQRLYSIYRDGCKVLKGKEISENNLSKKQVRKIVRMLLKGDSQAEIAEHFDIGQPNVSMINTGRNYSYVSREMVDAYPICRSKYSNNKSTWTS